ncbi:MAG: DUF1924 domain-containing protein [Proteobacteria bacterium]|nr:DUF1924 domain-containing protein [Pseudomonadota bacterium]
MIRPIRPTFWFIFLCIVTTAFAAPVHVILDSYRKKATLISSNFTEFSAERGRVFFSQKHPSKKGEISCATCHTIDPRKMGRTRANKDIEPMAPSVNPKRFTDSAKVEKWFVRNCDDVLGRLCTTVEKGDFIAYMLSLK